MSDHKDALRLRASREARKNEIKTGYVHFMKESFAQAALLLEGIIDLLEWQRSELDGKSAWTPRERERERFTHRDFPIVIALGTLSVANPEDIVTRNLGKTVKIGRKPKPTSSKHPRQRPASRLLLVRCVESCPPC